MIKCAVFGCWNMAPNRTGTCREHRPIPAFKPIDAKVRKLDPATWGFRSQAEMDRAFEGDGE